MIKICEECKNEFTTYDGKRKFCGIPCSSKYRSMAYKGIGNPMYGKHPVVLEKDRIRRAKSIKNWWADPNNDEGRKSIKKRMSEGRTGKTYEDLYGEEKAKQIKQRRKDQFKNKNPMHDPTVVKKISEINTGKKASEETKQKLSQYFSQPEISNQYAERMRGEKNPAWSGGCSNEYGPEFGKRIRREIRERDNHICQFCSTEENGKKLDVHHIDYDKFNNDPKNLISCCHPCHTNTLWNRDMWIEICQDIVSAKYDMRN